MKGSGNRKRAGKAGGERDNMPAVAPRKRRHVTPARGRAGKASNVVALADVMTDAEPSDARSARLPKGHTAKLLLFTGVQIVRDRSED